METITALFATAVSADPTRPLLTYYDDASGDRTELSGATLANWVAKTANLLIDGCGLTSGDTAAVLLPAHWQTAAVLLGAWSAGVVVDLDGGPGDVAFAGADRLAAARAPEIFGLALAPLAAPMRPAPPGVSDYVIEVRGHGDQFTPSAQVGAGDPALPGVRHRELCRRAADRAAGWGIPAGARVLVDGDVTVDPVDWLLAPLSVGATIVLSRNVDRTAVPGRLTAERVTVDLTARTG